MDEVHSFNNFSLKFFIQLLFLSAVAVCVSTKKTILILSYQTFVHTNGCKVKLAASAAVLTLNRGTQKSVCVPLSLSLFLWWVTTTTSFLHTLSNHC